MAVLTDLPSWTRVKSSANKTEIKTGKMETPVTPGWLMTGAKNKMPRTPRTTTQRIKAMRGRYWSLTRVLRKNKRVRVDRPTINKNRPMPTIGPVATKTTARAAGKNMPKPRMPMICRAAAMKAATSGNNKRRTIVLAGTPALTAWRMAYLTGLAGQGEERVWESRRDSKVPVEAPRTRLLPALASMARYWEVARKLTKTPIKNQGIIMRRRIH